MAGFRRDTLTWPTGFVCLITSWTLLYLALCPWQLCMSQRVSTERSLRGIFNGVENFRGFLVELSRIVTGTEIYKEQTSLTVVQRSPDGLGMLLNTVKGKMEALLKEKRDAVEKLRLAAQRAMKTYGPYKEFIDFQNVKYVNAKEVVIQKDLENVDAISGEEIKHTMHYLPTDPTWDFQEEEQKPMLNMNTSTIHVPTNIYDKSMTILNGIDWSTNITDQFIANAQEDPNLKWQYFCSSDGVFRLFPGMKWPREPDQVDTFDCRIRKWYIQAASSPKNILILLDTSGSMKGLRFSIARSTVNNILDTLSDEDYFNVMQFSHEARYVDECFNDTLVSASVDNIKRMQGKIALLEAKKFSNFELALTKAFKLFKKEQLEYHGHNLCNKAIMIITDGAPENFDSVFNKYNWPEKSIRVFTFLIGKEVPDNRQTRWMACANKGVFTHISTRADVQENVQKYIKVLSRPLAIQKISQEVWSPVYIDYTTDQADIVIPAGRTADLHMDFEMDSVYEGLGLVMTVSMAVLDERPEVGPNEESPERNILGVVGTDLRINELMRFIPTFELGVNGYAFAITNHGYILFHPDYRPFYSDKRVGTKQYLKVKHKYNSVDLSEVELTTSNASGWNKEHPLRKYLLMSRSGGYNMSLNSVLTHSDGMKRAKERRNHYQFKEIVDTFKLVFVVPDNYGTRFIQVDPKSVPSREKVIEVLDSTESQIDLSKWLYCVDGKSTSMSQLDVPKFYQYLNDGSLEQKCGKELTQRLLVDLNITVMYAQVWEGTLSKYVRTSRFNRYVKDYESCWDVPGATQEQAIAKKMCIIKQHMSNGIGKIWIGTSSGLTRYLDMNGHDLETFVLNTQTIKSLYYRRAVDGWEEGYKFVFAGPVVTSQKDFNYNTSVVTMSTAEILGNRPMQVPVAAVAFSMKYSAFYEKFLQYTSNSSYSYSCNDTEHFSCYLIDNNGYILATNNPDRNGTGLLLGQHNERIMSALLDDNIFKQLKLTDYQGMCETPIFINPDSSSSFKINPLKLLARGIFWLVSEIVLLLSEWSVFGSLRSALASGYELVVGTSAEGSECSGWIPEEVVRYLCGFVVDQNTGNKLVVNYITSKYSCVQTITRYTLNLNVLTSRPKRNQMSDCLTQCASKHKISYEARWLNDTNLVFVVVDASCLCNYSQPGEGDSSLANNTNRMIFTVVPKEVKHDDNTQCQILLNFSEELKLVDDTRTHNTICLDSTNETDTPCSQTTALRCSHVTSLTSFTITVLLIFMFSSSH